MAINFPDSPAINDIFTAGDRTWIWTGTVWNSVVSSTGGGASVTVGATEPENPADGDLWLDTNIERIKFYLNNEWVIQATYQDTRDIPEHTHNFAIGGGGFVSGVYIEGGYPNDTPLYFIYGGIPGTTTWSDSLDGGGVTSV